MFSLLFFSVFQVAVFQAVFQAVFPTKTVMHFLYPTFEIYIRHVVTFLMSLSQQQADLVTCILIFCGLFNYAVSSSDDIACNDMTVNGLERIWKEGVVA
jgi:hypothetical protein